MQCSTCGEEHPITDMEPSFLEPAAIVAVPKDQREQRVKTTKNEAMLWSASGGDGRCFLRGLVPIEVAGREQPLNFGLWVEVERDAFDFMAQCREQPTGNPEFPGEIANSVPGYPPMIGEPVTVFPMHNRVPALRFDDLEEHPFALQTAQGVTEHEVAQWLAMNSAGHDAGDPLLEIELAEPLDGACGDCGSPLQVLTRFVRDDGRDISLVRALLDPAHLPGKVLMQVSLGGHPSPDDQVPADRVLFTLMLWDNEEGGVVGVLDADASRFKDLPSWGRPLDQAEALEHPWLPLVWRITDKTMAIDGPVRRHLGRDA